MLGTATQIVQNKLSYSVQELAQMTSLSVAFLRNEIRLNNLKGKKFGARVFVLASDWDIYVESKKDCRSNNSENN